MNKRWMIGLTMNTFMSNPKEQGCPICGVTVKVDNPTKGEDLYCDDCNRVLDEYVLVDGPGGVKCSDANCDHWFCY
jgi:hypothetical protein